MLERYAEAATTSEATTLTAAAALVDNGDREKQRATFSSAVIISRNASVMFA